MGGGFFIAGRVKGGMQSAVLVQGLLSLVWVLYINFLHFNEGFK